MLVCRNSRYKGMHRGENVKHAHHTANTLGGWAGRYMYMAASHEPSVSTALSALSTVVIQWQPMVPLFAQ